MKISNQHPGLPVALMMCIVLSATIANAQARQELTQENCSLIFSRTDDCRRSRDMNGGVYCRAWYKGYADDVDEFLGYVFLKGIPFEGRKLNLLIGVTEDGRIFRVKSEETNSINQEFLVQFEGKTLRNNFEIARTIEDVLYVPSKVKAMHGDIQTSQTISDAVKEVLSSAQKLTSEKQGWKGQK